MQRDVAPIVLDICSGGRVVAVVLSEEPVDGVVRQAMEEAAVRAGHLVVIQLIDDESVLRRALAKSILARDLRWWSQSITNVEASVEIMDDGLVRDAVALLRDASCIVMSTRAAQSGRGMAVLRHRVPEMVSP